MTLVLTKESSLITKHWQVKHGLGVEEIVNHVMHSWEHATGKKRQ